MLPNNHKPQNDKPDSPIFIMGCPRTGTTLVRQILRCHSRLEIFHETQFYPIFHDVVKYYGDFNCQNNLIRFISDFHQTLGMLGLESGMKYLPDTDEILSTLDEPSCEAVFSATLSLYAKSHGKQRGGEKTPKHVSFLPLILERYPDSPVIFLMRDPRDAVHSMHKKFKTTIKGACNLWNESVYQYKKASRPVFLVKYEELVKTPEKVIREMCGFIVTAT